MNFYIVTPSYNCARYIDETILSVVSQSGGFSIHYHIQDGGSTDGTLEKLKAWEERLHAPSPWVFCKELTFTWDSSPDNGMYDAINKGFERLAPPEDGIMAWVNTDDTYFPHVFSTVAKAFADVPDMEWFGGTIVGLHKTGPMEFYQDYNQPYPMELIRGYCCGSEHWRVLQQNGMFWKGVLWKKAGVLNSTLRYAGDFELWPRFARYADFLHFPVVVGTHRFRDGQLSQNTMYKTEMEQVCSVAMREAAARVFWKNQKWPPMAPALRLDKNKNFFRCQQETFPTPHKHESWWKRALLFVLSPKAIIVIKRWRQHVCFVKK